MKGLRNVFALTVLLHAVGVLSNEQGHGFGDQYNWCDDLDTALVKAGEEDKFIMYILHESWCPECKKLGKQFNNSRVLKRWTKHFEIVNCMGDNCVPPGKDLTLDGDYVPKILFLTPNGTVLNQVYNKRGHPSYKYYYTNPDQIISSMKEVLLMQF